MGGMAFTLDDDEIAEIGKYYEENVHPHLVEDHEFLMSLKPEGMDASEHLEQIRKTAFLKIAMQMKGVLPENPVEFMMMVAHGAADMMTHAVEIYDAKKEEALLSEDSDG